MTPFCRSDHSKTMASKNILGCALLSVVGVLLLTQKNIGWMVFNIGDYSFLLAAFFTRCMVVTTKVLLDGKRLSALCTTSLQANVVTLEHWLYFFASDI